MDSRFLVLVALCVLPVLATAADEKQYTVEGRVYCDTCRAGYETEATPGIPGAKVAIECKNRVSSEVTFRTEGVTDSKGKYAITVTGDRGDDICDAVTLSSPLSYCSEADPGRNRARVILTNSNGLVSSTRYANAMGFFRYEPMSGCAQLLKKYEETDI
ncbi:protein DOWNSTREAM OF FLC-like [Diospyros lotus]|uniref:protein DOWNSTREAM OF FLC-like n=1 Tax=Diospyros lotus TaxID=55363 RepID=UPI0022584B32|nr:protein DOWNSTREAM OF FLC-like [Diospyros lotus]